MPNRVSCCYSIPTRPCKGINFALSLKHAILNGRQPLLNSYVIYLISNKLHLNQLTLITMSTHYCPVKVDLSVFEIIEIQSIRQVFEMKRT